MRHARPAALAREPRHTQGNVEARAGIDEIFRCAGSMLADARWTSLPFQQPQIDTGAVRSRSNQQ
jgi:hypothetical protein